MKCTRPLVTGLKTSHGQVPYIPGILSCHLEGLDSSLAEEHRSVSIGLKVHTYIKVLGLVVEVLHTSGCACHGHLLGRKDWWST